jgi:hypothetical protein
MIEDIYALRIDKGYKRFKFISEGPKGSILKGVQYEDTAIAGVYNLGFGDVNMLTNEIDDLAVSNNGDSQKVLVTVAKTLFYFTDHYPNAFIYATGSTLARTRLYRIGITNNLLLIEKDFHILGIKGNDAILFAENGDYDGFLVKRKK